MEKISIECFKNLDIKVYALKGRTTPATDFKNSRNLYKILAVINNELVVISAEIYKSGLLYTETITDYKRGWLYFQNSDPRHAIDQLNKLGFHWVFCWTL